KDGSEGGQYLRCPGWKGKSTSTTKEGCRRSRTSYREDWKGSDRKAGQAVFGGDHSYTASRATATIVDPATLMHWSWASKLVIYFLYSCFKALSSIIRVLERSCFVSSF